ncbi:MAG: hypothetical protein C0501_31520, partial [Isosphaera sp.]|nr:hypothetical protein [Isosphaera sp.]
RDQDPSVRHECIYGLGYLGPPASEAVRDLLTILEESDDSLRSVIFWSFGEIGPGARAAIPVLIDALGHADDDVRRTATDALVKIGLESIPQLLAVFIQRDWSKYYNNNVYDSITDVLRLIGPIAVPALVTKFREGDEIERLKALLLLYKMKTAAVAAVPVLALALRESTVEPDKLLMTLNSIAPHVDWNAFHAGQGTVAGVVQSFPQPQWIARMERLSDELIESLQSYYMVGKVCLGKDDGYFNVGTMSCMVGVSRPIFHKRMENVIEYFRRHFLEHGHPPAKRPPFRAAGYRDSRAEEEDRVVVFEGNRFGGRVCEPAGRWAWELTRDLLEREGALRVAPDEIVDNCDTMR